MPVVVTFDNRQKSYFCFEFFNQILAWIRIFCVYHSKQDIHFLIPNNNWFHRILVTFSSFSFFFYRLFEPFVSIHQLINQSIKETHTLIHTRTHSRTSLILSSTLHTKYIVVLLFFFLNNKKKTKFIIIVMIYQFPFIIIITSSLIPILTTTFMPFF